MGRTEVFISKDRVIINLENGEISTFTWEEFDDFEVAFDVVRRLSGGIKEKKFLVTIKEAKK